MVLAWLVKGFRAKLLTISLYIDTYIDAPREIVSWGPKEKVSLMTDSNGKYAAIIEAHRSDLLKQVNRSFDELRESIFSSPIAQTGTKIFKDPSDEDCRDPRNKNGPNMSEVGLELLFRLLDKGAGYNSAARKFSITQSAVKNRKKNWLEAGGQNRTKKFIPYHDTIV